MYRETVTSYTQTSVHRITVNTVTLPLPMLNREATGGGAARRYNWQPREEHTISTQTHTVVVGGSRRT